MKSFHAAVKLSRGDRFIQTNKHQNHTFATTHPQRGPKSNNNRPEKKKSFLSSMLSQIYISREEDEIAACNESRKTSLTTTNGKTNKRRDCCEYCD